MGLDSKLSRRTILKAATAAGLGSVGLSACTNSSKVINLEFFQFKPEAIGLFDRICENYNQNHPRVNVHQNFQADNITALRVRLVKNSMPDVISLNGDYNYGAVARSGVFYDFATTSLLDNIQPSVAEILPSLGRGGEGQVNAVPLANNGSGIIYNRTLFEEHSVEVPKTWDELLAVCEIFQAANIDPFYWGFGDNWTGAPMFSSLSGGYFASLGLSVANWYEMRLNAEVGFEELRPVLEKMKTIGQMGNSNKYEIGYNDGNQGFANGKSAMYVHGTYAIPAIRSYNPEVKLGTFATPQDNAADSRVVSGVDIALTTGVLPEYEEQSLEFIANIMQEQNVLEYCQEQVAYPTLINTASSDEALIGLQEYFETDRLATYSDHNFPQGVNLNNYMQQFLIDGDTDKFIRTLDEQWDRVTARMAATK